jgi:hypothetical protein
MKNLRFLILLVLLAARTVNAQQTNPAQSDSTSDSSAKALLAGRVLFIGCSATLSEANRVVLKWEIDSMVEGNYSAVEGDYFVIERSPDETHFETVAVVRVALGTGHYEITDGAAPNGLDYYRIKYTTRTGAPVYSKTMQLSLSGAVDFKFYPNPVDKLFIVRTEHTIDLQVIDAAGLIRLSKRLQPGIQVVNVSTLEKGVYILRVTDKESNRAVSHQLLKN